jgi:hypothetical protein
MRFSEKNLYFKNSSIKIKIIIWLLQLIYIKNYNIRSMKIKVDRVQNIAFRGPPVADSCTIHTVLISEKTNFMFTYDKMYIIIIL